MIVDTATDDQVPAIPIFWGMSVRKKRRDAQKVINVVDIKNIIFIGH